MSDETTTPEQKQYGANRATVFSPEPPPEAQTGLPPWQREPDPEPEPEEKAEETPAEDTSSEENAGADEANEASDEGEKEPEAKESEDEGDDGAGTGEEKADDASADDGDSGAGEDARRVRLDARSRRELRFNEQRAERALEERDTAREDLERMKARFAKLAENPHEAEELQQKFAEEDKALAERRAEEAKAPRAHKPTDDDRAWLEMAAQEDGISEDNARKFVEELTREAPKLVSAVRGLEFPVVMVEELARLQANDPKAYADVIRGSVVDVRRKLEMAEEQARTREKDGAKKEESAKEESAKEKKEEAPAKPPKNAPDKPLDQNTTPPPAPEEENPGSYTDERGTVWVNLPKKFKSWDMFAAQRPKA